MSRTSSKAGSKAGASASASARFTLPEPHTRLHPRSIGGVHINTEIHGPQDAPTVVLVHGWTCSIPFWAPVINALRDDLRVVVYDLRGHGASDVPGPGHYSVQALVDDLETVLDATLPGPSASTDADADDFSVRASARSPKAVLVGHSMGGMTLMASALRPSILNRTAAVLLASTGFTDLAAAARVFPFAARRPKWGARATRQVMRSRLPLGPVTPINRSMLRYSTLGPGADKQLATYNAAIIRACPPKSRAAWGKVLDRLELADALAALDVPASVIVGTVDRLTPPPQAHRLAELLPQCEGLTELPRVGHMTPLEAPDVLAAEIRRLVAAHLAPTQAVPRRAVPDHAPDGSTPVSLTTSASSSSSSSADAGDVPPDDPGADTTYADTTNAGTSPVSAASTSTLTSAPPAAALPTKAPTT